MDQSKPLATALRFGLIGGIVSIIISLVFFLLQMTESQISKYLGYAILILVIVLAIQHYRDKVSGGTYPLAVEPLLE